MLSSTGLNAWTTAVVHRSEEKKMRGWHSQKDYLDTYGEIVDTSVQELVGNIQELVKRWYKKEVTVEKDGLGSEKDIKAMLGMCMIVINV